VEAFSAGENQGTTFRVQLPTMILPAKPETTARQHRATERIQPLQLLADLHNVRVLAVDDEQDALALLTTVLETAGAHVTAVGSPHGAVERISESRPDVVLLDLGMPEIDGFELMKRIRSSTDDAVRRVPAAALTAFARAEDRTKALQCGFEMHLAKPIDPAELVASVAMLARRSKV
jgi:CheY-like chemotaxis protein